MPSSELKDPKFRYVWLMYYIHACPGVDTLDSDLTYHYACYVAPDRNPSLAGTRAQMITDVLNLATRRLLRLDRRELLDDDGRPQAVLACRLSRLGEQAVLRWHKEHGS